MIIILTFLTLLEKVGGGLVVVVVVVVNFIKHQNRAITGERVAARAAPSYQYAMVLVIIQQKHKTSMSHETDDIYVCFTFGWSRGKKRLLGRSLSSSLQLVRIE